MLAESWDNRALAKRRCFFGSTRRTYQRCYEHRPRGIGNLWVWAVQNHAGDDVDEQQSPAERVQERQGKFKLDG